LGEQSNCHYEFEKALVLLEAKQYLELVQYALPYATAGDADAQVQMGFLYSFGLGVVSDVDEAERWLMKAAEQGHPLAWNNLGTLLHDKDKERSRECYRRAVELGFAPARGLGE
jgi:TPR repeat protein